MNSSSPSRLMVRWLCCCLCIWASSCINVKERLIVQKNGKGEFTIEWDMSAARIFSDGRRDISTIEPAYLALLKDLENIPDIQLLKANTYLRPTSAQLSFQYKSLNGLNRAMTLIYIGKSQSSYEFVKQEGTLITRSLPPGLGERVVQRWKALLDTPLKQEERESMRLETQMECKSPIQLVYSPLPVQISSDEHLVNWDVNGETLFGESNLSVKILTN